MFLPVAVVSVFTAQIYLNLFYSVYLKGPSRVVHFQIESTFLEVAETPIELNSMCFSIYLKLIVNLKF